MTEQVPQGPPVGQGGTSPDPFSAGLDRLRETAKWLIAAFAGIAGVLLAGTQLSSLGEIESPVRFALAVISAVVALCAVGSVVWTASRILAVDTVSLNKLVEDEASSEEGGAESEDVAYIYANRRLLDECNTIKELSDHYDDVVKQRNTLIEENRWKEAREKENRKLYLDALISQLIYAVRYDKTRRNYDSAVRRMMIGGAVAAVGIFVFAWAANPGSNEAESTNPKLAQLSNRVQDQQEEINSLSNRIDSLDRKTERSTEAMEALRSEAAKVREQLEKNKTN